MVGRRLLTNIFLTLLILLQALQLDASAREADHIAILLSDTVESYASPISAFVDEIDMEIRTYNLHGDIRHDPQLQDRLLSVKPKLIFALGAKAAYAAKLWTIEHQNIPVIFAMVYNWQKYNLLNGQSNMAGIASEISPGVQFINLTMFAPSAKKIGVIYSAAYSELIVKKAEEAAALLGIELVERQISSSKDFKRTYRELIREIDGLWILNDPLTYTLDNMAWVEDRCAKDNLVCLGQTRHLTEVGMLLSVLPDMTNIGSQAASMARSIIFQGESPRKIGVMEPLGTHVLVNQRTADRIGLQFSSQAMSMATKVIK